MLQTKLRNTLVSLGAYFISWYISAPLTLLFSFLTNRIHYYGEFEGGILMPFVTGLPVILVACCVGAIIAWLVMDGNRLLWALIPAALFFVRVFASYHQVQPPSALDKLYRFMNAAYPSAACLVGAYFANRRLSRSNQSS
jgi:hypothetical protein